MVNHVVLFKLKDYPADKKASVISELKSMLESLQSKIKELKYIEVGVNHELDAKSFDIALTSHFESLEDLQIYINHPEHQKVGKRIMETTVSRAAVDYYF